MAVSEALAVELGEESPGARAWRRALSEVNGAMSPVHALNNLRTLIARNGPSNVLDKGDALAA